MDDYYLPEINAIGLIHVEKWLVENGYFDVTKKLLQSNDYGFIAKSNVEGIIVQIRTFLHPRKPFKLSEFEIKALAIKAEKLSLVAYAAYVIIDEKDELASDILWERLT